MSTPVNLNKVRKDRARRDRRAKAEENTVKFGRSKQERTRDAAGRDRDVKRLDDHKRET